MYNKTYYVYILASKKNGTLFIGITDNLPRRIFEHKNQLIPSAFTSKYDEFTLVYYEETSEVESAIQREKQLKHWNRKGKIELIEKDNPDWKDLAENWN